MRLELLPIAAVLFNVVMLGYFAIQVISVQWISPRVEHIICPECHRWLPEQLALDWHREGMHPTRTVEALVREDDGLGEDYTGHFRVLSKEEAALIEPVVEKTPVVVKSGGVIYMIQGGKK